MATIKQKKAVENIVKNKSSVGKAMREAGYTETTSKRPKDLTESKGFNELIEQYLLKEEEVFVEHRKNIKQDKDKGAKNKAVDMYYRLKGTYPKDNQDFEAGDLHITVSKD
jgi:hypothetical protein